MRVRDSAEFLKWGAQQGKKKLFMGVLEITTVKGFSIDSVCNDTPNNISEGGCSP